MEHTHVIPDHRVRLTDSSVAKLLGIKVEEYHSLSHLPIDADTDFNGKVVGFLIHINTNNNPGLLSKLNRDKNNIVRFRLWNLFPMGSVHRNKWKR